VFQLRYRTLKEIVDDQEDGLQGFGEFDDEWFLVI
jgi:hypothetical protein